MSISTIGFHERQLMSAIEFTFTGHWDAQFFYRFDNFFHPFVGELIAKLNRESLSGLLDPVWQKSLQSADPKADPMHDFFNQIYQPRNSNLVQIDSSPKKIDVSDYGPYSNYNWELLFHIPLTIAVHLSKAQRFAEAQRWFHYIFDPTSNDQSVEPKIRFWKFLAFRESSSITRIEDIVRILSSPRADLKSDEQQEQDGFLNGYDAIRNKPFQPHAVARTRHLAYQYCVVMKYLDNLLAWGDSLFQQDTIETINEATQIYVLAANVLGRRPQRIPPLTKMKAKSFAKLRKEGLGPIGNSLVELQGQISFNLTAPGNSPPPAEKGDEDALFGIGRTLYFCIPPNEKLLGYWDIVADRLFKIRHCMNIAGVVRSLALFEPPIDPGMLVKASAAGIDIGSIVNGLNQPIGPVRSLFLIQKTLELCGELRALGNALVSALEKGDAEHLAVVRQRHEIQIQQMAQEVRFLQWKSTQEGTTSLLASRKTVLERLHYYQRLLGLPSDPNAPDTLALDHRELTEENFDEAYSALVGQYDKTLTLQKFSELKIAADSSSSGLATLLSGSISGGLYLNTNEDTELNSHLPRARDSGFLASAFNATAAGLVMLPDKTKVNLHFWGLGGTLDIPIGKAIVAASKIPGDIAGIIAGWERDQAGIASRTASYQRRADDWTLQYNLAAHELMQIGRQILTSLISEQIAHHEYLNVQQQIRNAQEMDQFLHDKFTNEDLYLWMQGEISRLYYEYYRFTFDTARKAEKTMKQELMRPEVDAQDFIKFNYWDAGRKGLLSGEALYLDIKQMEMAYHENNKREYELTKHISLRQLDPLAFLVLRAIGSCEVTVPEWLFDFDGPGHYMRRIKNVSLSVPSVTGPYTSVNCTLSLLKSSLRTSPLGDDYARQGSEDDRFIDYFGTVQSIVTSSGNNDSGMFETNLREERLLPFEGAGAESTWKLELPKDFRQFDYNTIADVILHFRYTARQGGGQLREKAVDHINELIGEASSSGPALLFSLKQDFSNDWHRFITTTENFKTTVKREHFPYYTQGKGITIDAIQIYAIKGEKLEQNTLVELDFSALSDSLNDKDKLSFELSLTPGGAVLERKKEAAIFLLIRFSVNSA